MIHKRWNLIGKRKSYADYMAHQRAPYNLQKMESPAMLTELEYARLLGAPEELAH